MLQTRTVSRASSRQTARRLPVGAEPDGTGTHFRVWAPGRAEVSVCVEARGEFALTPEADGHFGGYVADAAAGQRYRFRLDGEEETYPDPASRFQPDGPHGPSEIVDTAAFRWTDSEWHGAGLAGQIAYEMHVGTFTPEGTWASAAERLPWLKEIGITLIEMMPVAEFGGRFGWGYDGVDLYAPTHLYGRPDDLRRFIARAHELGIGVILDVVYNHFGPDGCYLRCFSADYFTKRYENEWGDAINFDGENSEPVREFIISNACYWIEEFHFDGLRLDATQSIHDSSSPHILQQIAEAARDTSDFRRVVLVAENEPQHTVLVRPVAKGGYGLDALWNDDFHHSAVVALTGRNPAYYSDHRGTPQEFISAAKYGYLFQGQRYAWQVQPRGMPAFDLSPAQFVLFLENHDQVANSGLGLRLHRMTTPGRWRAFTALTLLLPGTPMLFQGAEFGSSRPFLYFADFQGELGEAVNDGRREFLSQFPELANGAAIPRPNDPETFARSKLDWREAETNAHVVALHRDLIALRARDSVFREQQPRCLDGAVIAPEAFLMRFFGKNGDDRLLFVNYGRDLNVEAIAEPLLAPPSGRGWRILWSSEDAKYGGGGIAPFETGTGLHIPGHAAMVLEPGDAVEFG
jgi:maltooligosyltrehalose trehalohydrolase